MIIKRLTCKVHCISLIRQLADQLVLPPTGGSAIEGPPYRSTPSLNCMSIKKQTPEPFPMLLEKQLLLIEARRFLPHGK